MIISIWRYSHLVLAVSSFLFVLIAALTGIVLSFEPITYKMMGYSIAGAADLSLAETLIHLKSTYAEILSLKVDHNGFVAVSAIDQAGNMGDFYVNPFTGEKLGEVVEKAPLFEFATSLHRSLFLKGLGRFFVGLSAFLLLLITVTGIILILKRQQGIKHFFATIQKESFYQYYHIYLGRISLIPILIITLSGTYLSLQRFDIIPEEAPLSHNIDFEHISETPKIDYSAFPIFKTTKLSALRVLEFPFSEDVEDYYTLQLTNKELLVNQLTGEILSEQSYPLVTLLSELSLTLHTGQGNVGWAIILGLSACGILFFIYSGFALTLKRKSTKLKNTFKKDDCKYIILVGSETGSTLPFAMQLQNQLLEIGEKSFITEMNRFSEFRKMEHLIVITSTYGQGEAPANANKFVALFSKFPPTQPYTYSVVGFGSLAYADFCQFALDVDQMLYKDTLSSRLLEVQTINNRSWEAYRHWGREWEKCIGLTLDFPAKSPIETTKKKQYTFKVIQKTAAVENPDDTFLIQLQPMQKLRLTSGDLLAVYPSEDEHERLYSMAVTKEQTILLSVKRHEKGICSNYLNNLSCGELLNASIVTNKDFHFPTKASKVVMISTGTGIAPFLGMLSQNSKQIETHLYWGGRNEASYALYRYSIENNLKERHLTRFAPAYSRVEKERNYVQHLIEKDQQLIAQTLDENGVIMVCGSIAMQQEVMQTLEKIVFNHNGHNLSYYQKKQQIRIDCY
ncbi:PepSY domain-containing protein [Limibacter armeniacum]|uniref:PepSY domain-containing protein n=1 Tax=Limibacter armeniacum TaxID=466084 RepID=UPI002FE50A97